MAMTNRKNSARRDLSARRTLPQPARLPGAREILHTLPKNIFFLNLSQRCAIEIIIV